MVTDSTEKALCPNCNKVFVRKAKPAGRKRLYCSTKCQTKKKKSTKNIRQIKRKTVEKLIQEHVHWANKRIALQFNVCDRMVAHVRKELELKNQIPVLEKLKGRDGRWRKCKLNYDKLFTIDECVVHFQNVVYFVLSVEVSLIKIGYAQDLMRRMRILSTQEASNLRILASVPSSLEYEDELHQRFCQNRHHGEWFIPNKELWNLIKSC